MYIRIIQGCLMFAVMIMFIFIAIVDQEYARFGFYASLGMILVIGLYLMKGTEEFIEYMNTQYRNNSREQSLSPAVKRAIDYGNDIHETKHYDK